METISFAFEMGIVMAALAFTVFLLVSEIIRIDLIATANTGLPDGQKVGPFGLVSVTPIGVALIATGFLDFLLLGRWALPSGGASDSTGTGQGRARERRSISGGFTASRRMISRSSFQRKAIWSLQAGVAIVATAFSLVMSNVGATVLPVPLAVSIAVAAGGNPAGCRVINFVGSGGIMTMLFLVVSLLVLNLLYQTKKTPC